MEMFIALTYIVGAIVVSVILRRKAGIRHHGRLTRYDGVGIIWFVKSTVQTMFWPVTVLYWAGRSAMKAR
jgi:hypothetical protein